MKPLTIGQLASRAGVRATTVRYYERQGLLPSPARTASNYRAYDQAAVERLKFIRTSRAAGLLLSDIKMLLEYRDGIVSPCRSVRDVLENRLRTVENSLGELRQLRKTLLSYVEICRRAEEEEDCGVIERLGKGNGDPA